MMPRYSTTVRVTDHDGTDLELDVTYEAWHQRAKVSGPPEDCYPADGELTVISTSPEFTPTPQQQAYVEDCCWEHFFQNQ